MSRLVASLSLIALLPALSGCATAIIGAAGATAMTATQERSFGEALDDAAVSNEIKSKLLAEPCLHQ